MRKRTGQPTGRPSLQNQVLAARVRELALTRVADILEAGPPVEPKKPKIVQAKKSKKNRDDDENDFYSEDPAYLEYLDALKKYNHDLELHDSLLKTMASASLPRLQEHGGPGGGPIQHTLSVIDQKKLTAILNGKQPQQESDGSDDEGETE